MQHAPPTWIYFLVIPLIIYIRLRRTRNAAQTADLWFEPEGDHFIYHPFGRWGGAFLVSPATRAAIRHRLAQFVRGAGLAFMAVAVGPMMLIAGDPADFLWLRPMIWPIRLVALALIMLGSLAWRRFALRPLYAGAPAAPRRIATATIRAKQAAARSWTALCVSVLFLGLICAGLLLRAYALHSAASSLFALPIAVLLALNLRIILVKFRLPRRPQESASF